MAIYHIVDKKLVEVSEEGNVIAVLDNRGAYIPVARRGEGKCLSYTYVRGNKYAISREAGSFQTLSINIAPTAILLCSDRRNGGVKYSHGWHMCGGTPCYVDVDGYVQCVYKDGVLIEICRKFMFQRVAFFAWKYAIGSQSAGILVDAALEAPVGMCVVVSPCKFRERGEWKYDHA